MDCLEVEVRSPFGTYSPRHRGKAANTPIAILHPTSPSLYSASRHDVTRFWAGEEHWHASRCKGMYAARSTRRAVKAIHLLSSTDCGRCQFSHRGTARLLHNGGRRDASRNCRRATTACTAAILSNSGWTRRRIGWHTTHQQPSVQYQE